jgi:Co/Zn/Cd efflux system component
MSLALPPCLMMPAVMLRAPLLRIPTSHAGATTLKMCADKRATTEQPVNAEVEPFARPNVRALTTTFVLSTTWTLAQLGGALVSRSSSLLSDALAMLVDDAAYAFNLAAELRPEQERTIKLAAPLVSAAILLVVTALSFSDAVETLQAADTAGSGEAVDGRVVLGFGAAMLLVDAMMLGAILFRGGTGSARDDAAAGEAGASSPWPCFGPPAACDPRTELNLFSGLSHVAADTLRSLTQVVVGAVILAGGPSETVDAYGTLVISVIILLGAAFLLYEVGLQFRDGLSG